MAAPGRLLARSVRPLIERVEDRAVVMFVVAERRDRALRLIGGHFRGHAPLWHTSLRGSPRDCSSAVLWCLLLTPHRGYDEAGERVLTGSADNDVKDQLGSTSAGLLGGEFWLTLVDF